MIRISSTLLLAYLTTLFAASSLRAEPQTRSDRMNGQYAGESRDDNEIGMKLVWCPRFEGLNERLKGYWIGKFEVTQTQWQSVMETTPWKGRQDVREGAAFPATYINAEEAVTFCKILTKKEHEAGRLPMDWSYMLPLRTMWDAACLSGMDARYCFGDDDSRLDDYCWYSRPGDEEQFPHEVGKKEPNAWGIYDMHGNVAEIAFDSESQWFIACGGCFKSAGVNCKAHWGYRFERGYWGRRNPCDGFRVICVQGGLTP